MPTIIRDTGPTKQCAVCGQVRPEQFFLVGVFRRRIPGTDRRVQERVTYCSDRAECARKAPHVSVTIPAPKAVSSRRHAAPGERPFSTKRRPDADPA